MDQPLIGSKRFKACTGKKWRKKNRISELPDDILVYVISLLNMKEAGRTSLLSRRWRYIWAYVPTLNFDASEILDDIKLRKKSLEVETPRYICWVDQVLSSYKSPTIEELRIQFYLRESNKPIVDTWVKFAMWKRVKKLEIDFSSRPIYSRNYYTFPSLSLCNSLTSLKLAYVNITGKVLEIFLSKCQVLDYLSVEVSETLTDLKVAGPKLNLKHLLISLCSKIKHLEISAPNLVFFNYIGPVINLPFKSTPKLAEISVGGLYGPYLSRLTNNFSEFPRCLSHLKGVHWRLN